MAHQRNTQAIRVAFTDQQPETRYRGHRASSTAGRRSLRIDKPYMSAEAAAFVERALGAFERAPKDERRLPREL